MSDFHLSDCVVLHGSELEPFRCASFRVCDGIVEEIDCTDPCESLSDGALVIIPGLVNAHTHVGDACLPDGATGLTLEEGFFRPGGYKYREFARLERDTILDAMVDSLSYMARTGTVCHFDFREQGADGARILREASVATGVESIILSQLDSVPFGERELTENLVRLPESAEMELNELLDVADGFSESTMNDLTDPAWHQIQEITQERGKLRAIPCLESENYRDRSVAMTGRGDLERAIEILKPHLIVHLTVANDTEIAQLELCRTNVVVNPQANASLGLPLPPVAKLLEANVNLMLGTDNVMLNSPDLFCELAFTYRIAKSQYGDSKRPDPNSILKMATSNTRNFPGRSRSGFLERGMDANFVVLDFEASHLKRSRNLHASIVTRVSPSDVVATYRRGKCLVHRDHRN